MAQSLKVRVLGLTLVMNSKNKLYHATCCKSCATCYKSCATCYKSYTTCYKSCATFNANRGNYITSSSIPCKSKHISLIQLTTIIKHLICGNTDLSSLLYIILFLFLSLSISLSLSLSLSFSVSLEAQIYLSI